MKMFYLLVATIVFTVSSAGAQSDSSLLVKLNQDIDQNVVNRNMAALENAYADDFIFSHGSGKVEGKTSWLKSAGKGLFVSRNHDSVTVEMHRDVAVVKGKLSVVKNNKEKTERYHLYYIRVYANRNGKWQMLSHSTTREYREN